MENGWKITEKPRENDGKLREVIGKHGSGWQIEEISDVIDFHAI